MPRAYRTQKLRVRPRAFACLRLCSTAKYENSGGDFNLATASIVSEYQDKNTKGKRVGARAFYERPSLYFENPRVRIDNIINIKSLLNVSVPLLLVSTFSTVSLRATCQINGI